MIDRANVSLSSRDQLRREIAQQTEMFLRRGGNIDVLGTQRTFVVRPVGPIWWDSRGSGSLPIGF
jgi:hypothetical protein